MNGWVYLSPTLPPSQFFAASIASTLIVPCNVLFLLYHGYLFFSLYRKIILLYFCVVCFCFQKFPLEMEVSGMSRVDGKTFFIFFRSTMGCIGRWFLQHSGSSRFPLKVEEKKRNWEGTRGHKKPKTVKGSLGSRSLFRLLYPHLVAVSESSFFRRELSQVISHEKLNFRTCQLRFCIKIVNKQASGPW